MRPARRFFVVVSLLTTLLSGMVRAQELPPDAASPWEGEVTGSNVYVRSGAGISHYPTTKLNTGDRVLVLDEKFGWYRIVPPDKSFSYIDRALVERIEGTDLAAVKQDRVFVRAGSHLVSRKSATQVVLNRGVQVEIIGEADGFYKIKPPHSAAVFVSKQYIRSVPKPLCTGLLERYMTQPRAAENARAATPLDSPLASSNRTPPVSPIGSPISTTDELAAEPPPLVESSDASAIVDSKPIGVEPSMMDLQEDAPAAAPQESEALAGGEETSRTTESLARIEADLKQTMEQSPSMRDLASLIERYQQFAGQAGESAFAKYAIARVEQLKNLDAIRKAKNRFAADADEIDAYRSRMGAERMKIMRARAEAALIKYDLEGELRRSYAFAPEKRRYRLVDPQQQATIAYIDVPVDVHADVEHMIGRFVGIRVSGRRYSQAARIPIAVAASITDLTLRNSSQAPESGKSPEDRNNSAETAKSLGQASRADQPREAVPDEKTAVADGSTDDGD
jgi:hypothetical protein